MMEEELLFRYIFIVIYAVFFGVRIRYRIESIRKEPEKRHHLYFMATKILVVAILGYTCRLVMINAPMGIPCIC